MVNLKPAYLWRQTPLLALLAAGAYAGKSAGYSLRFYEIAAQIIPVVLLVLAIELRAFSIPDRLLSVRRVESEDEWIKQMEADEWQGPVWLGFLFTLAFLVGGEIISLTAVAAQESPGKVGQAVVLGGIAAAFVRIAIDALRWTGPSGV